MTERACGKRRIRGNPCKTRIPTAAWKSLRLYHVSHRRDGDEHPLTQTGIIVDAGQPIVPRTPIANL